jgi:NPCBM/NEW2 domain-containing protein
VWILIAALMLTTATDADVSAKKLDGTTLSGTLQSWQDGQLVLATPTGPQHVAEAELLSLERSTPLTSAASPETHKPLVELIDGTMIPVAQYTQSPNKANVVPLQHISGEPRPISLPIGKVKSVRLQPMAGAIADQWTETLDSVSPSDLLVVFKRGGQSLDYLEGTIGSVTDGEVEFSHDGSKVKVSRDKVAGLIFYRANVATDESPRCVLVGVDELSIRCATVRLDANDLQITTSQGVNVRWPWAEISSADFSAGKLAFLSDLTPMSQAWQPLVALPASATHAAAIGQPRFDHAAVGGPLSLWYPEGEPSSATGHVESFSKGIALRSRTEIVYRVPRGFNRFLASAGIEPATRASGDVVLTILGDDRSLWEHPVSGRDAPLTVELDISAVKQLKIIVDYGKNLDTGDWLNLCNARLVK